jgi:hypothetical protein
MEEGSVVPPSGPV